MSDAPADIDDTERFFEEMVSHVTDILVLLDESGEIVYVNDAIERTLGYEVADLQGENAFEYVHAADRASAFDVFSTMIEADGDESVRTTFRFADADGEWVWVESEASAAPFSDEYYVTTVRNISERRSLEDRFQHFVESATDLITVIYEDSTLGYVSPVAERMLGYAPAEMVGTSLTEYVHPEDTDEVLAEIDTVLESCGETAGVEYRAQRADGAWIWVESRGQIVGPEAAVDGQLVVTTREITEQKERERALKHQNDRLDQFASMISHDLRNPLMRADGQLERAMAELQTPPVQRDDEFDDRTLESLRRVSIAHDDMESLIEDVLELARRGETIDDREPVHLEAVARETWARTEAPTADLEIGVPESATCLADRDRLAELFQNLYRNAEEHTEGSVTVQVETTTTGFAVADDGSGVPSEKHQTVLRRGISYGDGTGLGLAIVEDIAVAHSWDVVVTDSEAGGARIEVRDVSSLSTDGE